MRTISAAGLAELAKNLGTEPVVIIDIQWTEGGSIERYGDIEDLVNRVSGTIQSVDGLDNVITITGVTQGTTGESAQLSVTLSDIDGSIKNVLDQNDIHKRPCWVYQWFPSLDFSDRFLLFKGQISSPIEWHEGDRTIRFDIINQIEDAEVGFSAEEADIAYVREELIGKAWPLVFGTCIHVPALRMRTPFKGILQTGFGVHDFTIAAKLDQINHMCCPLVFAGYRTERSAAPPFSVKVIAQWIEEPGCKCRRLAQIETWEDSIALQSSYQYSSLTIIGGNIFPQGEVITLDICGAKVTGTFSGDIFTATKFEHPKANEFTIPPTKSWLGCGVRELPESEGGIKLGGGFYSSRDQVTNKDITLNPSCVGIGPSDRNDLGWDYLATFPTADFFWAEPGCEVFLDGEEDLVYVVNILPSTILRVAAYRTFESGVRQLVTVPAALYTSRLSDFSPYSVTEIVFSELLSRRDEGWEDEIFVSQTSTVGPNTVDILEWLITTYTSFTTDAASFASVKTAIDNYPSSFPILDRRNVLEVLRDIAFQARCALYLRNDEFTIRYLSDEPSSDFNISETDIHPKSLVLTHTETEELVTKFVATWQEDYALEEPNTVILRYNIKRYGTQEQEFDFFIYNIQELVEKSATFWLIRMANTWRKLKFKTPITKLQSEVFDVASVTLPDFSPNTIKCIVEKASYDSLNHEIEFELWTPVRSGSTSEFIFAWPANIDINYLWPTLEDRAAGNAGGNGPNVDVQAPASHPLNKPPQNISIDYSNCEKMKSRWGNDIVGACRTDHGDFAPSDLDDVKPTKKVPGQGETDIPTSKNPTGSPTISTIINNEHYAEDEADKTDSTVRGEQGGDGTDGTESGLPPDDLSALPCDNTGACTVTITYFWVRVDSVLIDGLANNTPGTEGPVVATTILANRSVAYNSLVAAQEGFNTLKSAGIGPGSIATVGDQLPFTASVNLNSSRWTVDCEEPESPGIVSFCDGGLTDSGETLALLS